MSKPRPLFVLLLLVACNFSLAAVLQPRVADWSRRAQSGGVLGLLMGDGRRLFANHFFTQADIYFHSGYYPSIFDSAAAPKDSSHMKEQEPGHHDHDVRAGEAGHQEHQEDEGGTHSETEHEREMNFLGPPRDWVEAFGRRFIITKHTHLEEGKQREMLPWLRLSAELDPQRVDTYTVAAYWLTTIGRVKEAEEFLREGLRHNPESYEILFDLARLLDEKKGATDRAQNLCALALVRWQQQEAGKENPDLLTYEKIVYRLGQLEEKTGQIERSIEHFEMARKVSPNPAQIEEHIQKLKARLAGQSKGGR